jgi:hypothetical protein
MSEIIVYPFLFWEKEYYLHLSVKYVSYSVKYYHFQLLVWLGYTPNKLVWVLLHVAINNPFNCNNNAACL